MARPALQSATELPSAIELRPGKAATKPNPSPAGRESFVRLHVFNLPARNRALRARRAGPAPSRSGPSRIQAAQEFLVGLAVDIRQVRQRVVAPPGFALQEAADDVDQGFQGGAFAPDDALRLLLGEPDDRLRSSAASPGSIRSPSTRRARPRRSRRRRPSWCRGS